LSRSTQESGNPQKEINNPANKNNLYPIFKELTSKNGRKMTGEIDNFLLPFPFFASFAGPPDKLAEALIFICKF